MNAPMKALRWFSISGRLGRGGFAIAIVVGVAVKFRVDRFVATAFGESWSPLSYVDFSGFGTSITRLPDAHARFLAALLATSLPFSWFGFACTVRRLRDAGLSLWLAFLFFVPAINAIFAAILVAWPPATEGAGDEARIPDALLGRIVPRSLFGSAVVAIASTALLGLVTLVFGSQYLAEYGWGLFVAAPFTQGALTAIVFGAHRRRKLVETLGAATASIALSAGMLLLFSFEGGLCIVMALPLAVSFALLGALFGHQLQRRLPGGGSVLASIAILIVAAPVTMGAALRNPAPVPVFEVVSTIVVAAPPDVVWQRVVAFPDLPPPTQLPFTLGVAYPMGARIIGRGVGAVRYCRFSTGPFVEPVTRWEPPRLLAFRVAHNPEPMQEWSPFAHVHPPHLDGYMESLHGQFELQPLSGGRTLLTGRTWYRHHLWPATYWSWWSNAIVHQIHLRVLDHIAELAQNDVASRKSTIQMVRN